MLGEGALHEVEAAGELELVAVGAGVGGRELRLAAERVGGCLGGQVGGGRGGGWFLFFGFAHRDRMGKRMFRI